MSFLLSSLGIKLISGVLVLLVAGGILTYTHVRQFNRGYASAIKDVSTENKRAKGEIDEGVQAIDSCYNANGVWNSVTGMCN